MTLQFSESAIMTDNLTHSPASALSLSASILSEALLSPVSLTVAPVIISFDGNIGSGKSTKVKDIEQYYKDQGRKDTIFIQEPVDSWNSVVDENGVTILSNYYKNQKRFAFRLQMLAYISRLSLLRDAVKKGYKYIITERCVGTDRNVFSKMLYDKGDIEHDEYTIYKKWYDEFISDVPIGAIVYIKASPETCLERVNIRAREGENIPLDYLKECSKYHDEWIDSENVPKLVINADIDLNKNPEANLGILQQIDTFITSL
jgi:deoxyadenosine/deoxycytidine kinase